MKVKIRRIIGITALLLWVIAIVPKIILDYNGRLMWQLDKWAFMLAPVFSIAYAVMLTIHIAKGKRWTIKLLECIGCGVITLVCIGVFFIALILLDYRIWDNKDYVVYDEFGGFGDPSVYVLYQRNGIIEERPTFIRFGVWREDGKNYKIKNADYTIYESFDLIKEEADIKLVEDDSMLHETTFYRLSGGQRYEQNQNDSLWRLISNSQEN